MLSKRLEQQASTLLYRLRKSDVTARSRDESSDVCGDAILMNDLVFRVHRVALQVVASILGAAFGAINHVFPFDQGVVAARETTGQVEHFYLKSYDM